MSVVFRKPLGKVRDTCGASRSRQAVNELLGDDYMEGAPKCSEAHQNGERLRGAPVMLPGLVGRIAAGAFQRGAQNFNARVRAIEKAQKLAKLP